MASNEPQKRSIIGNFVANRLTEWENDLTLNATYVANRSVEDLRKIAANGKSKFSASELLSSYTDLKELAKEKLYSASTGYIMLSCRTSGNRFPYLLTVGHGNKGNRPIIEQPYFDNDRQLPSTTVINSL